MSSAGLAPLELLTATNRAIPGTNPPFVPGSTGYSSGSVTTNGEGFSLSGVGPGSISFIWGNPTAPTLAGSGLLRLGTDLTPAQSFSVFHALRDDGQVVASSSNGLFVGTTTVASAGSALPAGMSTALGLSGGSPVYASFSFQAMGAFGNDPFYRMGWSGGPAGATQGVALLRGSPDAPTLLVKTGDLLSDLPTAVNTGNASIQIESTAFSRGSDDWITRVQIVNNTSLGVTSSTNSALVRNGEVLRAAGGLVRTGTPLTLADARPGEIWNRLDRTAVAGEGRYAFTALGFVAGGPGLSSLAVVNDEIVLRQGETFDYEGRSYLIGSSFGQIAMNAQGDWALSVAADEVGTGVRSDLLLVNGSPVAIMGQSLYDLDGVATPLGDLSKAVGRLTLTDRNDLGEATAVFQAFLSPTSGNLGYFTARVVIPEPTLITLLVPAMLLLRRRA
jgi:hypothetical protein